MINTIGKLIVMIAIIVFIAFVGVWLVAITLAVVLITALVLSIAWVCDARFSVTEQGVVTGYYKRSTGFVPVKRGLISDTGV